jgi:hypothetical protein
MSVMDILKSYLERPTDTQQDFDEVASTVPAETLGSGIADAFRSDRTPDFGQMVASLFGGSDSQQRAGLLGQLARAVGPGLLASLAGGALGRLGPASAGGSQAGANTPHFSASDAAQITTEQVREIATAAEKNDPSVLDRVGEYYAQHPQVVKALGGAALAIALAQVAKRMHR